MPDEPASEEEQVRRLLAEARHTEPMPDDVAGRMDGVIADLRADRPVRPTVADLASARRRRRAGALLLAAAAVVVVGVGVDRLRGSVGGEADSTAAGGSASQAEDAPAPAAKPSASDDPKDSYDNGARSSASVPVPAEPTVRLGEQSFGRQVGRLRRQELRYALQHGAALDGVEGTAGAGGGGCTVEDPGRGVLVAVRYHGAPGLLVYRPVNGDTQVVDLYLCGRDGPVRSITLPAP